MLEMPRVREINPEDASSEQREFFEVDVALFGTPLSASRVYALQPDVFRRVQELHAALAATTRLPPGLVARARTRVAELHSSPF